LGKGQKEIITSRKFACRQLKCRLPFAETLLSTKDYAKKNKCWGGVEKEKRERGQRGKPIWPPTRRRDDWTPSLASSLYACVNNLNSLYSIFLGAFQAGGRISRKQAAPQPYVSFSMFCSCPCFLS